MFPNFRRQKHEVQKQVIRNPNNDLSNPTHELQADLPPHSAILPDVEHESNSDRPASLQIPIRGRRQLSHEKKAKERSRDRKLDPLGLTILFEPDGLPTADIVFVHGLGGSSRQTWSKDRDPSLFWPLEWLPYEPVISSARISTFGYNAHFTTLSGRNNILNISDFAKDLLFQLRFATGAGERPLTIGSVPLIFVAHSMGGLVVKKAMILGHYDSNYNDLIRSVSAVVFLSTPHRGSDLAETLNKLLSACVFAFSSKQYIDELKANSPTLNELNEQFRNFAPDIEIVSFFETEATLVGLSKILILQRDSSTLGYPNEISKPLNANHHDVCKFSNQHDTSYISIRDILKYIIAKKKPPYVIREEPHGIHDMEILSESLNHPEVPADDQEYFADKRFEGSCEWILDEPEVSSFLEEGDPLPRILWLFGKPGSGKSVTASFLISMLHEQGVERAFYFFRFGDQIKNNLTSFLLSLAWQLALQLPEYRRRLARLFDDGLNVRKSAPRLIWQKLFVGALLKSNIESPLFIIVDALDETESAVLLLKHFGDLTGSRLPLRLILVSRKTQSLVAAFEKLSKLVEVRSVVIDNTNHDLRMYVEEEMEAMRGDESFKSATTARVLQKADGNFLWAHLVVNEILLCHTEDHVEDALNHVPEDLEPLYERMDETLMKSIKTADRALGRAILRWATCSRFPLTLGELKDAIEPEYPRVLDLEHTIHLVCGEFVVVDKRSYVTMIHSSARDFLMTNSQLNFHVSPPETHQILFARCMSALTASGARARVVHAQSGDKGKALYNSDYENFPKQIPSTPGNENETRTFLHYAATSWPYHLKASSAWADQESLAILARFFRSPLVLQWMFFLSISGRLRVLVEASKILTDFLNVSDRLDAGRSPLTHRLSEKDILAGWANDLVRVVGKFGAQLVHHPRTIFNLIPAFCPIQSIIHTQFAAKAFFETPKIAGLSNLEWDDCLAKFAVPGSSLPLQILSLDRYFSILTSDGTLRLYHTATCEEARAFRHGERVLTMAFSAAGNRVATYGFLKTKVWDTRTAKLLFSLENPARAKALTITFANSDESILTCSDDRIVRLCRLSGWQYGWEIVQDVFGSDSSENQEYTSPQKASFNADCTMIAIAYRGHALMVWSLNEPRPWLIGRCEGQRERVRPGQRSRDKVLGAHALCWNPMTGHVLGISNEGYVFKWHPVELEYATSVTRATNIKCSADGRIFVTSSNNGMLRMWDFEHFTPIYKLSYAASIQDFAIDQNEFRIYDIRERFCNVWEPNAIMGLFTSDDRASDVTSTHESSLQTLPPSETLINSSEPVTTLAVCRDRDLHAVGTDEGRISIFDSAGRRVAELSERFMTIEHICWSSDGALIASVDLSRSLMIEQILPGKGSLTVSTVLVANEPNSVHQILFNPTSTKLLLSTVTAVNVYSIQSQKVSQSIPEVRTHHWINHPIDNKLLLGIGPYGVEVYDWDDLMKSNHRLIGPSEPMPTLDQPFDLTKRRPSATYPTSPDEITSRTTKVLFSVDGQLVLTETSETTLQGKRRKQHTIVDVPSITKSGAEVVTARRVSPQLQTILEVPLGFLSVNAATDHAVRERSLAQPAAQLGSSTNVHGGEHVLAFLDRDFWVCTTTLSENHDQPGIIRRHFFLPRDWLNMDWLELATLTKDGKILCPRNGEVAIISNGFAEEWLD